jgi:uncharacterized protein DUF3667
VSQVVERAAAACANCQQPLTGRYCARCGEKALAPESLTVRHFVVHTLADELVHLDGKFWSTLRNLIARPGFLSTEYCAGRRRRYIQPGKLLIASILTYALATQGGLLVTLTLGWFIGNMAPTAIRSNVGLEETVRRIDRLEILKRMLTAKAKSVDISSDAVRERFHAKLNAFAQPVSFCNVILLTVALYLIFHRRRPLLLDHAIFSMHTVSFVLLSSLAFIPGIRLLRLPYSILSLFVVMIWQFVYLSAAIRRFYFVGGRRPWRSRVAAVGTAILIYILNSAFITAIQLIGGAIALHSL